jgi:hypothetical protein
VLKEHGIRCILELTGQAMVANTWVLVPMIADSGTALSFAVDDFGAGYSSPRMVPGWPSRWKTRYFLRSHEFRSGRVLHVPGA